MKYFWEFFGGLRFCLFGIVREEEGFIFLFILESSGCLRIFSRWRRGFTSFFRVSSRLGIGGFRRNRCFLKIDIGDRGVRDLVVLCLFFFVGWGGV